MNNFKVMTLARRVTFVALAGVMACTAAHGAPAIKGLVSYTQPDGTLLNIRICGDEYCHYILTEDGYPLMNRGDGTYCYATLTPSGIAVASDMAASNPESRTRQEKRSMENCDRQKIIDAMVEGASASGRRNIPDRVGLFPDASYPVTGSPKALVVLVEYADVKFTLDHPGDYFNSLLNTPGFSGYGATGCASDWFRENSGGKFTPQFDVLGPVTLGGNRAYYGSNNAYNVDSAPQRMVIEACQQLDSTVDFSQYDTDGDGYIDNVFLFFAGTGENRSGETDAVWPHTSWVTQLEWTEYKYDGVTLDRYACTNEWVGEMPDGIGTFCHEFSHVMGLPDLYDTKSGSMPYTPGEWSVMDYGPYLNDGRTPPLYSSFERMALGWLVPEELTDHRSMALTTLADNRAYSVTREGTGEYFLLENRVPQGWDSFLPGHGMLVWHVEYDPQVWLDRKVNNEEHRQRVDIVEADDVRTVLSRGGDTFPGTEGISDFSPFTVPSFSYRDGTSPGLALSAIKERPDGSVTFRVGDGDPAPADVSCLWVEEITATTAKLTWSGIREVHDYLLYVTDLSAGDMRVMQTGDVTEYAVIDLMPQTPYRFEIYAFDGLEESLNPAVAEESTSSPEIDYYTCEITGATDVTSDSFVLNWNAVPLATDYIVDVSSITRDNPYVDTVDFTDGLSGLPAHWSTSSRLTYANNSYSGQAPLSLRLAADGDYITSGTLDAPVYHLSFWHRGSSTNQDDYIEVLIYSEGEWIRHCTLPTVTAAGGVNEQIDLSQTAARGVKLVFHKSSDKGSLALDDIVMTWGGEITTHPLETWTTHLAGGAESLAVTGLTPNTEYMATVRATDGNLCSGTSSPCYVTTRPGASLYETPADGDRIRYFDLFGRRIASPSEGQIVIRRTTDGRTVKTFPTGK